MEERNYHRTVVYSHCYDDLGDAERAWDATKASGRKICRADMVGAALVRPAIEEFGVATLVPHSVSSMRCGVPLTC